MRWWYSSDPHRLVCLVVVVLVSVSIRSVDREGGTLHCGVGATAIMETTGHEKAMNDHTNEEEEGDEEDDEEGEEEEDTNYYADVEEAYAEQHALYTAIVLDEAATNLDDMWDLFHCTQIQNAAPEGHLPIHAASVWTFLRGAYIGTVGYRNSTLRYDTVWHNGYDDAAARARATATQTRRQDPEHHDSSEPHAASSSSSSSVAPPILVKYHPQKGRAVYANQLFHQGEVVRTQDYTACFPTGSLYRQFLVAIPPYLACDVLEWAYSGTSYGICVDLDEGSYTNHASTPVYDRSTGVRLIGKRTRYYEAALPQDVPNVSQDRALRDIHVGEELLTDYDEFAEVAAWSDFGLGGWPAPEDDDDDEDDDNEDGREDIPTTSEEL